MTGCRAKRFFAAKWCAPGRNRRGAEGHPERIGAFAPENKATRARKGPRAFGENGWSLVYGVTRRRLKFMNTAS